MYRLITNPVGQNDDNLMKLYNSTDGCCPDSDAPCQYDVTIPTANAVNNIIFKDLDGVNKTVTFSPAVTGAADVKAAIKAALVANNWWEDDDDDVPGVSSTTSGSNTIYHITGEAVIVSMLHNTSTTVAATAKCDRINICTFYVEFPGDADTQFVVNGVNADLNSLTYAGSSAAQVVSAIEGAANWPTTADVAVVKEDDVFKITITDIGTDTFEIGGLEFERSDCRAGYVA